MNGSVMFISINPIGKLPRQKKNTAQKLVANGAVLGITVEAENDLRHGGCKERIRERGIERDNNNILINRISSSSKETCLLSLSCQVSSN